MKVALVAVLALVCVGCVSAAVPGATSDGSSVKFVAEGQAVAAKEDDALAMAEANLAAAVIAKANLLETIKGAMISNSVSVGDLMLRSQEAELKVSGFLSRAVVTYKEAPATRLGTSPVVTAIASITLSSEDYASLPKYVE